MYQGSQQQEGAEGWWGGKGVQVDAEGQLMWMDDREQRLRDGEQVGRTNEGKKESKKEMKRWKGIR